jgi:hypothetical protein
MNTYFILVCLLICIHALSVYSSEGGNVQGRYFYRTGSVAILGDEFRSKSGTVSRFDCLRRCLDCHAVMFNEITKVCRHYIQRNSTLVPADGDQSSDHLWISEHMKSKFLFFLF